MIVRRDAASLEECWRQEDTPIRSMARPDSLAAEDINLGDQVTPHRRVAATDETQSSWVAQSLVHATDKFLGQVDRINLIEAACVGQHEGWPRT